MHRIEFNFEVQCDVRRVGFEEVRQEKSVSLPNMIVNRDASICGTVLVWQAQRHRSRARYACCSASKS